VKTVCGFCRHIEECVWILQTDWILYVVSADGLRTVCGFCRRIEDCVWFVQTDWRLCVVSADGSKTVCDFWRRIEDYMLFLQTDLRLCVIPAGGLKLKFLKWKSRDGGQFYFPKSHSFNSRHQNLFYHWHDRAEIFPKSWCFREQFSTIHRYKVPKPFASRGYLSA
jgi:hypothetical protein